MGPLGGRPDKCVTRRSRSIEPTISFTPVKRRGWDRPLGLSCAKSGCEHVSSVGSTRLPLRPAGVTPEVVANVSRHRAVFGKLGFTPEYPDL